MPKIYILAIKHGDDSGAVVQHANSVEQAKYLIKNILPPAQFGHTYYIVKQ